jgi:hypothetical protein
MSNNENIGITEYTSLLQMGVSDMVLIILKFQFIVIFHQSKTRLQSLPVRYRTSHKPTYIQKTLNKQKIHQ